jgi:succinyl-CoA synthetase beta subunit
MHLHEFQAKQILKDVGIPVPDFFVVASEKEIDDLLKKTGWQSAVVKIQIHAGGRGKAGGVKLGHHPDEIKALVRELLGKKFITPQTGPEGMVAHQLLISPIIPIVHEYYLGLTISRELSQTILIASPVGGVDIEHVASEHPSQILTLPLPEEGQFRTYQLLRLAKFMGWKGKTAEEGIAIVKNLVLAFVASDANLLEINPLIETAEGNLIALDAKLTVDDNALYRQPALKQMFDSTQISPYEARAVAHDLAYVALEGDVGCMVNGAGLAMATMDLIHFFGGEPANFLDVGGSASADKVAEGFRIILSDPKAKAILVNIFGGIMNCDTIAEGVIAAAKDQHINIPLVVRLEGTNVEQGRKILEESGLDIVNTNSLTEAAQQAVKLAKQKRGS